MNNGQKSLSINETFIIEAENDGTMSACTGFFTNALVSCTGNTQILLGDNIIEANSAFSATTFYGDGSNLTGVSKQDIFVTGGTYNTNNGVATFTNNTGGTFSLTGFYTGTTDVYVTGVTFSNNLLTLQRNDGVSFSATINDFVSLNVNGPLSATTFYGNGSNLTGISTPNLNQVTSVGNVDTNGIISYGGFYLNDELSATTITLFNDEPNVGILLINNPQNQTNLQVLSNRINFANNTKSIWYYPNISKPSGDYTLASLDDISGATSGLTSTYVPYTGATQDVNLGTHSISSEKGIYQFNDNNNQIALEKLEHYNRIYMDTTDTSSDEFGRFSLEANPELGLAVDHSKTGWNGSSFRLNRDGIEGYTFDETGSVVENRFNFTKDYFSVDKQIKSDTGLEVTNSPTGIFSVDNENPNYLSFGFLSNDISGDEFGSVLVNFNPEEAIVLRKDKPIFNSSGFIGLTEGDISLSVDNPDYQQRITIQSGDISLSVNDAQVNANNRLQILSESTYSEKLINTDVGFQITSGPEGEFFVTPTGNYLTYNFTSNGTLNGTPLVSITANSEEGINLTNYDTLNSIISSLAILPNQTIIETNDGTSISQTRFLSTSTTFDKPISVPKVIMNSTTEVAGEKELVWNDVDGTVDVGLKGGNVKLQLGQEQVARVVNKTSPLIDLLEANYQVVKIVGATGQRLSVALAQADSTLNSAVTLGVVTETILRNEEGFVTTNGQVKEINTTGSLQGETWSDGDVLYLSPTVAGRLTNIRPLAPNKAVIIGFVEYAHSQHGKIFVRIDAGLSVNDLDDVATSGVTNGQVLAYSAGTQVWTNRSVTDVIGYTPLPTQALTGNGVTLSFTTDRVYGTLSSPETATGITANVTGALLGVTNILIHSGATSPTFSSEYKKLSGSGNYITGQVNYIFATYIAPTEIIYSINQRT